MTTDAPATPSRQVLDPIDRLSEILFGLIMVLTFTGSISVATADRAETKTVLIAAIGCNIAWGLIDAIMYLMACLHRRGTDVAAVRAVRRAASPDAAHQVIRDNVPAVVADELSRDVLDRIRQRIASRELPDNPRLGREDFRGAAGVFLVVVASTAPVILPFLFLHDVSLAMRLSNAIAVAMLALIGYGYGRASGISPLWTSASMVILGAVLVTITIALGG